METTDYYGAAVGLTLTLMFLASAAPSLVRQWGEWRVRVRCLQFLDDRHPGAARSLRGVIRIVGYDLVLFLAFLVVNFCCVYSKDGSSVVRRLGHVILVNMIFLGIGGRVNPFINLAAIRHKHWANTHAWVGYLVILSIGIHAGLSHLFDTGRANDAGPVAGLIAASSAGAIFLTSNPFFRHWLFDTFSNAHLVLALVMLVATWFHIAHLSIRKPPLLYVILCGAVFATSRVTRLLSMLYRSRWNQTVATISPLGTGLEVRVHIARNINAKPGQYVYLTLLGVTPLSFFRPRPFQIAWTYRDAESGRQVLVLLVQPRSGYTALLLADKGREKRHRALIEGPYGRRLALDQYGTILLIATGIGIAGQLPYVRDLLRLHSNCDAKIRKITLIWEVDSEVQRFWVREWMNNLLEADKDYVLDIRVFIRGNYLSSKADKGTVERLGDHHRITLTYDAMKPQSIMESELSIRKGRTLVCLCTNPDTTRDISNYMWTSKWSAFLGGDIHLKEHEFHPWAISKTDTETSYVP